MYAARQFWNKIIFFWMRWLQAKLNLHGDFLGSVVTLVCFEAKHTCVIHGLARYSFFCFRSKRVDRCVGVEHEELSGSRRPDIVSGDHTHLACLLGPVLTMFGKSKSENQKSKINV